MSAIAGRSIQARRNRHGWAAWVLLAIPFGGIGSLIYASSQKVVRPSISLFQAVDGGDIAAIRAHALTGTDLNQLDPAGHTALYEAISSENDKAASTLIRYGAKANVERNGLETPLTLAAGLGNISIVQQLLRAGAQVNDLQERELTPLFAGATSGNADVVALLIRNGADPNAQMGSTGTTPLAVSAWRGDLRSADLMLGAGARVDARGYGGRTPLDQAAVRGHVEVVQRLLKAGAKADETDANGMNALALAQQSGSVQAVMILRSHIHGYHPNLAKP